MKLFLAFQLSWLLYGLGKPVLMFSNGLGNWVFCRSYYIQKWGRLNDGPWDIVYQQWYPTAEDLDDLALHCEEQCDKLIKNGSTGDWVEYTSVDNSVTNQLLDDILECHEIAKHSVLYTRMPECWEFGKIEKILSRWTNVAREINNV